MLNIYYCSTIISLFFFLIVLELVRRRKLKEQYSLFWLLVSMAMVIISLHPDILEKMAEVLGIYYAPAAIFFLGLIFAFALILHFTIIISKFNFQYLRTVQELALLKQRVQQLEKNIQEKDATYE